MLPLISEDSSGFTTVTVVRGGGAAGSVSFEFAGDVQQGTPGKVVLDKFVHGNSHGSTKAQHLYETYNRQTGDVVKTGISGRALNRDGSSPRANSQVNKLNRAHGQGQYGARIIQSNIPGRAQAIAAEKANATSLHRQGNSLQFHKLPRP